MLYESEVLKFLWGEGHRSLLDSEENLLTLSPRKMHIFTTFYVQFLKFHSYLK